MTKIYLRGKKTKEEKKRIGEINKLDKPFNITSVCRADMLEIMSKEKALKITDSQMKQIASRMADAYCDNGFWVDLPIITELVVEGF